MLNRMGCPLNILNQTRLLNLRETGIHPLRVHKTFVALSMDKNLFGIDPLEAKVATESEIEKELNTRRRNRTGQWTIVSTVQRLGKRKPFSL